VSGDRAALWVLLLVGTACLAAATALSVLGARLRAQGLERARAVTTLEHQLSHAPGDVLAESERAYRRARAGSDLMRLATVVGVIGWLQLVVFFVVRVVILGILAGT
jgi:hypothetical protein